MQIHRHRYSCTVWCKWGISKCTLLKLCYFSEVLSLSLFLYSYSFFVVALRISVPWVICFIDGHWGCCSWRLWEAMLQGRAVAHVDLLMTFVRMSIGCTARSGIAWSKSRQPIHFYISNCLPQSHSNLHSHRWHSSWFLYPFPALDFIRLFISAHLIAK